MIEEFKEGIEVSLDSFVHNRKAHIISTCLKHNLVDEKKSSVQCYGSIAPADLSQTVQTILQNLVQQIVDVF